MAPYSVKKMNTEHLDKEFIILENIYNHNDKLRQRELSQSTGISLGMTNMIVKRLVKRECSSRANQQQEHPLRRHPDGINEIMKRSFRYFKRTMDNIARYRTKIDALIRSVKEKDFPASASSGKAIWISSSSISAICRD